MLNETVTFSLYAAALSFSTDGVLNITRSPKDNEEFFEMELPGTSPFFRDNRTGISIAGSTKDSSDGQLLQCDFEYIGTASTPSVVWIRNGTVVMKDATHNIEDTFMSGMSSTLEIIDFALSDVGEYQCIFTDGDSDAEIAMSVPYRLDTGKPIQYSRKCVRHNFYF